jgi:hypothetical protein
MIAKINESFQPGDSDLRYFPRWEVNNRVLYQFENEYDLHQGRTRDLSCVGARLRAEAPFETRKISLTIFLSPRISVTVQGRVLWVSGDHGNSEAGITFENVSQEAQDMILQHAFEMDPDSVVNRWFEGWSGSSGPENGP